MHMEPIKQLSSHLPFKNFVDIEMSDLICASGLKRSLILSFVYVRHTCPDSINILRDYMTFDGMAVIWFALSQHFVTYCHDSLVALKLFTT